MKRALADGWFQMFAAVSGLCLLILLADKLKPRAEPLAPSGAIAPAYPVPDVPTAAAAAAVPQAPGPGAGEAARPDDSKLMDEALEKYGAGDYGAAERLSKKYMQSHPGDPMSLSTHASSLLHLGRLEEAAEEYRADIPLEPGNDAPRSILAGTLLKLGRPVEALKEADDGLKLHPDSKYLHTARAAALEALGRTGEAAEDQALAKGRDSSPEAMVKPPGDAAKYDDAAKPAGPPSSFPMFKITAKKRGRWVISNEDGDDVDSPSVMRAVLSAADGDVIQLKPGIYAEPLYVYGKKLTFKGLGDRPEEVLVTAPRLDAVLRAVHADVRLENLRVEPEKGFSAGAAAVWASSARVTLKDVVARSQGVAVQATQGQDDEIAVDVTGGVLDGGYADLLVRGRGRAAARGAEFTNPRQPVVAWRGVTVRLDSCRFPKSAAARVYAYEESAVSAADGAPPVAAERAAKDAEADRGRFEDPTRSRPMAPDRRTRGGTSKWGKDIFRPGRTPGDIYQ